MKIKTQEDVQSLTEKARGAANMLKALSHETRLLIVCSVSEGEKSVLEIADLLQTTQSNISQHLAKLRDKGILKTRKVGNQVFYGVKNCEVLKIIEVLCRMYGYR